MLSGTPRQTKKSAAQVFDIFLKNITRILPQYVFWKDTQSMYLGCNQNYAELVGLHSPEEIIGKTDLDLNWQLGGHTAELFQQGDRETLTGYPITNQQETLVLPNGKKLITLVSKLPIYDDLQNPLGIVGCFTDITPLKEKERELRQAKKQAEAANQTKSLFLMNISHDIRTPLSGLLGMAEILAQQMRGKADETAALDLIEAGKHLLDFLNEVIEFSKCESGDLPLYDQKFNLQELVNKVIALIKPSAHAKQLILNLTWDPYIPLYLIGDPIRIHRILLNLLTNAVKFTPRGHIDVRVAVLRKLKRQRFIIQLQVQDTGIGIPKDKQDLIFTRFERVHPAYQGQYHGCGLGLALVKQFIDALDGEISVESKENQGSTLTCLIPLREALSCPIYAEAISHPVAKKLQPTRELNQSIKVLLVEDNPLVQTATKHLLQSLDLCVDTAATGQKTLTQIQTQDYSLILMDIGLPDQSGCDVAKAVHRWQKKQRKKLSVIVALSAHLDEIETQRCFDSGMQQVFIKPLDKEKARELISKFVGGI